MMKNIIVLLVVLAVAAEAQFRKAIVIQPSATELVGDGVFQDTQNIGEVKSGVFASNTFPDISLPQEGGFDITSISANIINAATNEVIDRSVFTSATVSIGVSGIAPIFGASVSNFNVPVSLPSPYVIRVRAGESLQVVTGIELHYQSQTPINVSVEYTFKWQAYSTASVVVYRSATSATPDFAPFNTTGTGGTFTQSNAISWPASADLIWAVGNADDGVISVSLEATGGAAVCTSLPTYTSGYVTSMSPCTAQVLLTQGSSYTTTVLYNNTHVLGHVVGNIAYYLATPAAPTTSSDTTANPDTTHASSTHATGTHTTASTGSTGSTHTTGTSATQTSAAHSSSGPTSGGHSSSPSSHSSSGPSSSSQTSAAHSSASTSSSSASSATSSTSSSSETSSSSSTGYADGGFGDAPAESPVEYARESLRLDKNEAPANEEDVDAEFFDDWGVVRSNNNEQ